MPTVASRISELVDLDGSAPESFVVREITPDGHATKVFVVVADYGWAERIVSGRCYERDANAIALSLGDSLGVPATVTQPG